MSDGIDQQPKTTQLKCGFCNVQPMPLGMTVMKLGDPRIAVFFCHVYFCGGCQAIIGVQAMAQDEQLIQTAGPGPIGRI